ncbi:FHA domain-containing protein [Mastigocladopsis repens]|uniref:FHA domain-containing protein n=1 Tax=Mastigocladopsis repens TaxID=221287 RepID=UPI00036CB0CB|nr:FHA domain-containing protein [Mastigocladopsis repens]
MLRNSFFSAILNQDKTEDKYFYTIWDGVPMRSASTHGVYVNYKKIYKAPLSNGDIITFGSANLYPHLIFTEECFKLEHSKETCGLEYAA